ncbi:hypothetical protein HDR58_10445 [bacterium]|nr:hypothetical protein [bacterium]
MLSVNPMSSVNFRGGIDLAKPGRFTRPDTAQDQNITAAQPTKKKKSKVLPTILGLATIAAALIALPKLLPNAIKSLPKENLANAGILEKAGHYTAVAGEFLAKYTIDPLMNLFKGSKAA